MRTGSAVTGVQQAAPPPACLAGLYLDDEIEIAVTAPPEHAPRFLAARGARLAVDLAVVSVDHVSLYGPGTRSATGAKRSAASGATRMLIVNPSVRQ